MDYEEQIQAILDRHSGSSFQIVQMEDECNEIEMMVDVPIWLQGFACASDAAEYWYGQFRALDDMVLDVETMQID